MYKKFGSTSMVVARLLADRQREMLCRVIVETISPLMSAHGKELSQLRAPDKVLEYCIGYAKGSYTFVIRKMFTTMERAQSMAFVGLQTAGMPKEGEVGLLSSCGSGGASSSSNNIAPAQAPAELDASLVAITDDESNVARSWVQLCAGVAKHRFATMLQWTDLYPGQFAPLLSEKQCEVDEYLRRAKDSWEVMCEVEKRMHSSVLVKDLYEVGLGGLNRFVGSPVPGKAWRSRVGQHVC